MNRALKPVRRRDLVQQLAEVLVDAGVTIPEAVDEFHRAVLAVALARCDNNQVETAKRNGMPRNTLRNQMLSLGMLSGPAKKEDPQ